MADNYLGYQNPTSVDAKLDTESLTVGANTVHRERIEIAGAAATDIAVVTAANGLQVDVTRSALPTGAATSAKQDTGNTSLASIDTKTPALGQALAAASVPVVLTAAQLTTLTPPAAITNYALETGGNLALAAASLSVLDDWDESDRAKVNPIAGQAGVQGGAGAVSALTQRVVIATDQTALPVTPALDVAPATQNITVIDSGSSTATGANNQSIVIGTPTAGSAASFALSGIETIRVEVTGIWTGTLTAEFSIDGGTTWTSQGLHQGAYTTSSFTAGFIGGANVAGATNFRMRATAAITGTAVVKVIESVNTQSVYIANAAPSGTVISVLNSTTATLTSGSVYTGTGEDVTNFSEMRISVISDVASATNGLSIQQSSNNTNWDITDTYTIAAATGATFVVPRQARYFRVVYTNGGTNQTSFRLQVILNRTATAPSSQRPADAQTNETDLVQNQGFLMGYNGATWDRLRSTTANGLAVDVTRLSALVAGSAVIGKVSIDQTTPGTTNLVALTAETTKVIGTVNIAASQTIAVTNTGTFAVQATPVTQADTFMLGGVNIKEINAVTPLMGNGATGTGSQRVTIASDNTAFAVNATLQTSTNSIGKITDITASVVPGTAATNLGKAEDAAHTSGDTGVAVWGVRNDNLATTFGNDQDYGPLATDLNGRVMVAQKAATATLSNVASSATTVTILAANSARIGATIFNDSTQIVYVKFGTTASTTSYTVQLATNTYYEVPAGYTGRIDGIWVSANGNARVTEIT